MDVPKGISGAQTLRRGLAILRLLAENHEQGLRVADVAALTGLERATAHRLLAALVEEHFAEREPDGKLYRLGMEAMRLGMASMKRAPLVDTYRPVMQRISRISGDTTFLIVRQGDWTMCLHREEGPFPVRIFTTEVGSVRPLGIGAAGLVLLATQSDAFIQDYLVRQAAALRKHGREPGQLLQAVQRFRTLGYSETMHELTEGVYGVGASIPLADGTFAAVSIGAIQSRMNDERRARLGKQLRNALNEAVDSPDLQ